MSNDNPKYYNIIFSKIDAPFQAAHMLVNKGYGIISNFL